jgi:putative ABC transport system permease protein
VNKPSYTKPPRLGQRLLLVFLRDELAEEVLGDLDEKFYAMLEETSPFRARLHYYYQVLHYLRPFAIRKTSFFHLFYHPMFRSDFKIAWRSLARQKTYSSIKIGGFALGIAACLLIALFIRNELSYDRHYPNADRLYRMTVEYHINGEIIKGIHFQAPFAKTLKAEFPEVERAGRFNSSELFGAGNKQIRRADSRENAYEEGFTYADQEMLDMLGVSMVYGNRAKALNEPNTLVLSRRKAEQYFPGENPVGKLMILNDDEKIPYKVGGVMENFPATAHLSYDFLITLTGVEFWPGEQNNWMSTNYPTYVLLRDGTRAADLEKKLAGLIEKYIVPYFKEAGRMDADKRAKMIHFKLQPITDIYLKSYDYHPDGLTYGDIRLIGLFGAIAAFILVIAGINFINLSTAKSANRAKEVGVRKVVGSVRSLLVKQFLTESVLFSFLSFGLGLILAWLALPYFNALSGKNLALPWQEWWLLPLLAGAAIFMGILAGLYPSFYLSAFRPIEVLKGNLSRGSKSATTRSALVVFQFATSIILIVGTFIIQRQMGYILHKKVGFDKEQVLLLHGTNTLGEGIRSLKNELLRLPEVKAASISDYLPIKGTKRNGDPVWKEGKSKEESPVSAQKWEVDPDYLPTLGIQLVAGRNFSPQMASDSAAVIINQAMVRKLGLKNPIGARITNDQLWTVIGVVEDFHYESLRDSIQPIYLKLGNSPSILSVKVRTADMGTLLTSVNRVWKEFAPNQPIRYSFLDENFARMYEDVERTGRIFSSFAILAIVVACLGLYGLSSFMVEQRRKEMSIRRVLGASVRNIFSLLTLNFVKLVLLAFLIAVPIGWYGMHQWLEDFVYRTPVSPWIFLLAGLAALLIALITISYQAFRAALTKPVQGLRSE